MLPVGVQTVIMRKTAIHAIAEDQMIQDVRCEYTRGFCGSAGIVSHVLMCERHSVSITGTCSPHMGCVFPQQLVAGKASSRLSRVCRHCLVGSS
jgi:hypothetical protein